MPSFRLFSRPGLRCAGAAPFVIAIGALVFAPSVVAPSVAVAQPADAGSAVPVTVAVATTRDLPVMLRNIGAVQANQSVLIRTRVDGTLEKVLFTEGQEVRQGDPIVQIDPRPYQAILDQAQAKLAADQAQLVNARLILNRSSQLARNSFTPQATVDTQASTVAQFEAQIKSDVAAIDAAKLNLDYTTITAPFDGRLGLRQMDPGTVVRFADTSGVGIVTLSQIHPIAVVFSLPQDALPAIQAAMARDAAKGGKLAVTAIAADDRTKLSEGTLLTVDNAIDPTSGTIKLKAVFANTDNKLWPGQFVNASLLLGTRTGVLVVPSVAVQHAPERRFIYVVQPDSTVTAQTVEVDQDDGQVAVVTKGLEAGAHVVVNGQSRLRQGTRVAVVTPKTNS
jgi:multidrug efflux system membrane fusion protein